MKIIENYNRAKQKYGVSVAQLMLSKGIPSKYVFLACKYHIEDKIPIEMLQLRFHQWVLYIRNKGKENFDVNKLTYERFDQIVLEAIREALKPHPIYDDGTVFLGEFKTKEDALLYPLYNKWCTSESSSKYNEYTNKGYRLFIIENNKLDYPLKRVCAAIGHGNVEYWNTDGFQLLENLVNDVENSEHQLYQKTLPKPVVEYLYDVAANQTEGRVNNELNCNRKMMMRKNTVRLTESKLRGMIHEAVKRTLMEMESVEMGEQYPFNDPYSDEPEPVEHDCDGYVVVDDHSGEVIAICRDTETAIRKCDEYRKSAYFWGFHFAD